MDISENFDPENVRRITWWWSGGQYRVNEPGIDRMEAVAAEDYERLLALYRALKPRACSGCSSEFLETEDRYCEECVCRSMRDAKPQMTIEEVYGSVEIK